MNPRMITLPSPGLAPSNAPAACAPWNATALGDPSPIPAPAPLRILLVEDSAADVALISHTLRAFGRNISVVSVDTRPAFEAELIERTPDIILSDDAMPTFDGKRALEIAQRRSPHVPFIFVTGTLGEEVAIDLLRQGATDYVFKNRLSRLVPAVNRALAESAVYRARALTEEKLRRSHDRLRALTGHLQSVREEERGRIALEVHDHLGQALTGLKIDLSWLAGKLPASRALQTKIKSMCGHIDETILAVRRIATALRPGVLDTLGLTAAIEWQATEFRERTGIACELKVAATETLWERDFSTACFRIFQEILTNIARHAKATRVEVNLTQEEEALILSVRDNGSGIAEADVANASSIGLSGMKERAAQVGGEVFFFGLPGRGTTVTVRLPLPIAAGPAEGGT